MKIYLILILALISNDPREVAKINALKKEAERAYLNGDYELAASKYTFLADSMGVEDDLITLNLGHSYFQLGDTTSAKLNYGKVGRSDDRGLRSIAYQQLGVMSKDAGKLEESLQQLKSAIKADPSNRDAVYDYEVVKKLLDEQKQQQQDQQNQDQQDQDQEQKDDENQEKQDQDKEGEQENQEQEQQENQEQSEQENQEGEQQEQEQEQQDGEQQEQEQEKSQEEMTKEKLEEMGISEEKARQLLEAMRQSEIKYLQNQKRKATKRPPSGKPDW